MSVQNSMVPLALARNVPAAAYEPSSWLLKEFAKPQFHEAGHAVVARLMGFRVEWVSVDSTFIDNDPIAIENQSTGFGPVCMTISSERVNPIISPIGNAPRRGIRTKKDRETIIGYATHVLAGPYTEMGLDPDSFDRSGCERDLEQIAFVLDLAEPNRVAKKKLLAAASRRVDRLLDEHWKTISRVAWELYDRRTLFGYEIDSIMNGVELKEAA